MIEQDQQGMQSMKRNTLAFLIMMLFVQLSVAQTPIQIGEKYTISSNLFEEEREVWLGLPTYFDSTKSYPVLYVLDAEWQFDITLAVMKELTANDKAPAHIVVGIPKMDVPHRFKDLTFTDTQAGSDGKADPSLAAFFNGDLTGGGKTFLSHITEEVMPFVGERFLVNGFDVLLGHSLSGYFGAYIMSLDQPFDAYQLYDPSIWYNKMDVVSHLEEAIVPGFQANVFIASAGGGRDREPYNLMAHEELHALLQGRGIHSTLKVYPTEDHGSVRLAALIDGISHLYEGYAFGYIMPEDKVTAADADQHYKAFSQKVNFTFHVPPDAYRWIGFANHSQENWEEALKAYQKCRETYAEDVHVCGEISDCYQGLGDHKKSLFYLEKALDIDPENPTLIAKLKTRKEDQ